MPTYIQLQLRLTHKIKPFLSHFLTTSDMIPRRATEPPGAVPLSVAPPVAAPTVLYYLPAILLPEQEAFLMERQEATAAQVASEQHAWKDERKQGMEEVELLRRRAEELATGGDVADEVEEGKAASVQEEVASATFPETSVDAVLSAAKVEADDAEEEALEY
ncbi:hypothetical protein CALVIDRAFT_390192 [Calocera viscosa TUFC12733]|uniref:Uncharacterized protein n=1 Tax=Calocera viscosa (strain TUFC12733) TaxID=1330018 RepID=A0A167GIF0_CALVF|nr:hypothetical protein CALVIDRAFT_390192 [Calocera viscosa TUFC12733]